MRVEENLAGLATEQARVSSSRKGKKKKKQKKSESMPTVVQRLFDTCKDVFADCGPGIIPSPEKIGMLRSMLDSMKPSDVGLSPKMPYFRSNEFRGPPPITYLHLYECPRFSIGIFCLPPSAVIPLHNHPGMTVFSKILFGSMHIKSYDWTDASQITSEMIKPAHLQDRDLRLAKVNTDAVFIAPCETSILYPAAGGNMHCFTAKTSVAVLDVLGPPYDDAAKRHCAYYTTFPCANISEDPAAASSEGEMYAWLEEKEKKPDDLIVVGAKYKGPKIVQH
ncbi:plant cysteine oxidase 2-like [Asparagus officinalis]|uniref:plant cysteine oxidase 2-like n=1 Tax=Asparagus officinalis TaxID=4686 RepID=UPI00098E2AC1|nr:plant cysteine oxidase 2-like [Asparagus officinalis]